MKKLLAMAGILGIIALTGCTTASADEKEKGDLSVVEVDLQDGYYLSDKDDSYIHIENGMIELCGYDIDGKAKENYEKYKEEDCVKISLDEWIANAEEVFEPLFAWKEYTPVCFTQAGENGDDLTLLVVDYEFALEKGTFTGYVVNDDGTICREENTYTYKGAQL